MDTSQEPTTGARVLGPKDGEVAGAPESRTDRFMIDSKDTGGRLSVVEHTLPPHVLAGPLHYHSREDEYSYVLEGRLGAVLGDQEVVAEAGDLVFKPRGQWHTFWNAGDGPCRILEIISPAGFEHYFDEVAAGVGSPEEYQARYGTQVDLDRTRHLCEQHGLRFPIDE